MNKNQLQELKVDIEDALLQRRALGEFDANSKHIALLLAGMLAMVEHAKAKEKK